MIDFIFNSIRKGLVATLALVFAFVIVYTPQSFKPAEAQLTVFDSANFVPNLKTQVESTIQTGIGTINVANTTALVAKEFGLDAIAYALARAVVSSIVASTVDWINSGFQGSPAFITDLDGFLLNVADQEAGKFIASLGDVGSFLCSPFKLDIQIALAIEYENIRANRPYEGCTISGIVDNLETFLDGNFGEDGWKDWFTLTAQPDKYTPYGQELEAKARLYNSVRTKTENEKTVAGFGDGFLSGKICENVERQDGGTYLKCSIAKPGRMIADSLTKALGAGTDTLISADEINEIVGALIAQLATKAITGTAGLLGLSSGTGYTYPGFDGGSYTSAAVAAGDQQTGGAQGLATIERALQVQLDYKALADSSIPTLQAYINNPLSPQQKVPIAQSALRDALLVQNQAPQYASQLQDMINRYQAFEQEFAAANTSADRKGAIRQEQITIINSFISLTVYSSAELSASETSWDPTFY